MRKVPMATPATAPDFNPSFEVLVWVGTAAEVEELTRDEVGRRLPVVVDFVEVARFGEVSAAVACVDEGVTVEVVGFPEFEMDVG